MSLNIESKKDLENLTLTFSSEFDAPVERVWQIWEDPRQLERWWGPPTYPATFVRHEFVPGGRASYYMTSPEGDKFWGWWEIQAVDAPNTFVFTDGFADDNGDPVDDVAPPTETVVTLEDIGGRTRMTSVGKFSSLEGLQKQLDMGMVEGMTMALGQIPAILEEQSAEVR